MISGRGDEAYLAAGGPARHVPVLRDEVMAALDKGIRERPLAAPLLAERARLHTAKGHLDQAVEDAARAAHVCWNDPNLTALVRSDAAFRDERGDIGAGRPDIFRLAFSGGDHLRVGCEAFERGVEGRARDAACLRIRPQVCYEGLKIIFRFFSRSPRVCDENNR